MFDLSTIFQKATQFLGDGSAADLSDRVDPAALLEQAGVDPANLTDPSNIDTEALLSKVGLDGQGVGDGSVMESVLAKLNAMKQ